MEPETLIREIQLNPAAASTEGMDKAVEMLRSKGFRGILLIVPPKVSLDSPMGLPLVGFDSHVSTERAGIDFRYFSILVATSLESNETVAGTLHRVRDDEDPPPRVVPPRIAEVMNRFTANARDRIEGLPWRPGTLSLVVLLFDERSNQASVSLLPAVGDHTQHDEIKQAPDAIYPAPVLEAVGTASGYPRYRPETGTPPIPAATGISLSAQPTANYNPGEKCILRGSFRLPVLPHNIVPKAPGGKPLMLVGDERATAVVPVSLVVMGDQMVGAVVVPLKVPTYDRIDAASDAKVVTGSLNIDLFAVKEMPKTSQRFTIWAFSNEIIGGPSTVTFVPQGSSNQ